ncbi:MAG: AI-2E family transporter [Gaiella sp.]
MDSDRSLQISITFKTLLIGVALVFFSWAIITVRETLLVVAVGIFLGLVFEGPVRWVEGHTRLGRGLAATVTVIGALLAASVLVLLLALPMLRSLQQLLQELPQLVDQLKSSDELSSVSDSGAADDVSSGAQSIASAVPDALSELVGFAGSAFSFFVTIFLITFICLFFLCEVKDLKRALASVLPTGQEGVWLPLWDRITEMVSRWAIGVLIIATIAGTVQGTTAYLLGSSYALALGLLAGFLDMIPNIGATIAGFILTIVLWAEEGLTAAVIMLVVVLVYQQIENNLITPTVQGKAVNLSAFFIIVAVAIFGALLGVIGALIAVPMAAMIQIILGEVTKTYREQVALQKAADGAADVSSPDVEGASA